MRTKKTISVDVFLSPVFDDSKYLISFEMPFYSQSKRVRDYLKKWEEEQVRNDFKHNRIRYYNFRINTLIPSVF